MTSLIDLTNQKIGKLTILHSIKKNDNHIVYWVCRCDCGNLRTVNGQHLRSGQTTSCKDCAEYKFKGAKNKGDSTFNYVYRMYKRNADNRHLAFTLSAEQTKLITSSNCHYCGKSPAQSGKTVQNFRGNYFYNGIDRVDNTKGYILGNVVPCCGTCNRAKYRMTSEEFKEWIFSVYQHLSSL